MARDRKLAVAMMAKYEPLLESDVELERIKLALECCISPPNVLKHGYGGVDTARLKRTISLIRQGYGLPREPEAEEMFNASFLPPEHDRTIK
jgi:NitT/TauT family transport system substrate-binding protein